MNLSRRQLLKLFSYASATTIVSSGLQGCGGGSTTENVDTFGYGVASGDPLEDRVIIWTRVTPEKDEPLMVAWQVAEDEAFETLVNEDSAEVTSYTHYTLKVDVTQLDAGKTYYYRFFCNDESSPVGVTKTLPDQTSSPQSAKFAVFSCANFPAGFFHIYEAAAERAEQIDAVLHIGDYIYEYDKNGYSDAGTGEDIGRVHDPVNECITLEDYRTRYAQYRSDPMLQKLHAAVPFICVWDDHEVANDTYKDGAENHQPDEGDFEDRRADAIQAWYDWLPVRPPEIEANKIKTYRRFEFGDLLSLLMLDTRVIGRDKQLDYFEYYTQEGQLDLVSLNNDLQAEDRTILGQEQYSWLEEQLTDSVAKGQKWQLLGQQVLMGRMELPASVLQPNAEGIPELENFIIYQTVALAYKNLATKVVLDLYNNDNDNNGKTDLEDYAATIPGFYDLTQTEQAIALTEAVRENDPDRFNAIFATLSDEDQAALQQYGDLLDPDLNPKIPYNLDAWDGYPAERDKLYSKAKELAANMVVIAGDTHNGWANLLTDKDGNTVSVEFATSSVSSPGLEVYLSIPDGAEQDFEDGLVYLVDDLKYCNISQRGYLEITFDSDKVTGEWLFIPRHAEKSTDKPTLSSLKSYYSERGNPKFVTP